MGRTVLNVKRVTPPNANSVILQPFPMMKEFVLYACLHALPVHQVFAFSAMMGFHWCHPTQLESASSVMTGSADSVMKMTPLFASTVQMGPPRMALLVCNVLSTVRDVGKRAPWFAIGARRATTIQMESVLHVGQAANNVRLLRSATSAYKVSTSTKQTNVSCAFHSAQHVMMKASAQLTRMGWPMCMVRLSNSHRAAQRVNPKILKSVGCLNKDTTWTVALLDDAKITV